MDPITFAIIRHRLFRVVDEAVITLKHVSGSAITNEGHDLMVSLYRADGSLLMGGVGFLHHLTSAAEACKSIIRRFGERIEEDDIYLLNDPYTAALHTSDVYLIAPIHYEARWSHGVPASSTSMTSAPPIRAASVPRPITFIPKGSARPVYASCITAS